MLAVEGELLVVVGHGECDVPEVGEGVVGHEISSSRWEGIRARRRSGGFATRCGDAAHQAGDVGVGAVIEHPLAELDRCGDDGAWRGAVGGRRTPPTGRRPRAVCSAVPRALRRLRVPALRPAPGSAGKRARRRR